MSTGTLPPVTADLVARLRAAAAAASPSEARTWVPAATRATGFQQTLFRVMRALVARFRPSHLSPLSSPF